MPDLILTHRQPTVHIYILHLSTLKHSDWSMDGVTTEQTSTSEIVCATNHLTSFAILVSTQRVSLTAFSAPVHYCCTAVHVCSQSAYIFT